MPIFSSYSASSLSKLLQQGEILTKFSAPPPPQPLKRPAPALYFHQFFKFFRFPSPLLGGNQNLLPPPHPFKKGAVQTM